MVDDCCYCVACGRSGSGRGKCCPTGPFTAPLSLMLYALTPGDEWVQSAQLRRGYIRTKGFCNSTPSRSKSPTFRVTTVSR